MALIPRIPWRVRRDERAELRSSELESLRTRCTVYEHGIDTVLLLASRMSAHPNRSVRAYTDSIQRVLGPVAEPPLEHTFDPELVLPGGVTVSRTIAAFLRRWGDDLEGEDRWSDEDSPSSAFDDVPNALEGARAWLCTDWLVRAHTAAWLRLADLDEPAELIDRLPGLRDAADLRSAGPVLRAVAEAAEHVQGELAAVHEARSDREAPSTTTLVQIARSAWSATAAGAAVEAGAAWCPDASRATEAAIWSWAYRHSNSSASSDWRAALQAHVDALQGSALRLVADMLDAEGHVERRFGEPR